MSQKKLRDIIQEVMANNTSKQKFSKPFTFNYHKSVYKLRKSTLEKGNKVEIGTHDSKDGSRRYEIHAHNKDDTPKVKLQAFSNSDDPKQLHVSSLDSAEGNEVKAHELYHHLIMEHGLELSGSSHSTGAQRVWHKLAQHPDIQVKGLHVSGKEVTIPYGTFEMFHQHAYHPQSKIIRLTARARDPSKVKQLE